MQSQVLSDAWFKSIWVDDSPISGFIVGIIVVHLCIIKYFVLQNSEKNKTFLCFFDFA